MTSLVTRVLAGFFLQERNYYLATAVHGYAPYIICQRGKRLTFDPKGYQLPVLDCCYEVLSSCLLAALSETLYAALMRITNDAARVARKVRSMSVSSPYSTTAHSKNGSIF